MKNNPLTREKKFAKRIMKDGRLFSPLATAHNASGYANYGCRCTECSSAAKKKQEEIHAFRMRQRIEVDGRMVSVMIEKHGLNGYSNYGCRCHTCSEARSQDDKKGQS